MENQKTAKNPITVFFTILFSILDTLYLLLSFLLGLLLYFLIRIKFDSSFYYSYTPTPQLPLQLLSYLTITILPHYPTTTTTTTTSYIILYYIILYRKIIK